MAAVTNKLSPLHFWNKIFLTQVHSKHSLDLQWVSVCLVFKGDVPKKKGYLAVYVGENEKKHFVIPIPYLNQPSIQDLLDLIIQQVALQSLAEKMSSKI